MMLVARYCGLSLRSVAKLGADGCPSLPDAQGCNDYALSPAAYPELAYILYSTPAIEGTPYPPY